MYTWDGRYIEQDYDEPTLRTRCQCGAFLPRKPKEHKRSIPTEWEETYDSEGNVATFTVLEEEIEIEEYWRCSRCKREYNSGEMYG